MRKLDGQVAMGACGVALGTLAAVALFQSGAIDRLPDPPGRLFDSERITSSKMAHPGGIPDSYLGLVSYGTTLALILLARRQGRAPQQRWAHRLLGFKLMADAGAAGFNAVRQVAVFGKVCSWCTGTALATAGMVYGGRAAMAEAVRSVRSTV